MISFFVRRPITTIMFVLVFVVLGAVGYTSLRIESTPSIKFPMVTVSVTYPGATPLEIETLVVNKIEDAVAEISEIKEIKSRSYDNFGYVFVEFLLTSDVNVKSAEVKDKVEAIVNQFPDAAEKPIIEKYDPLMTPVMELVLSSDTLDIRDLYEYADKTLRTRFSSIDGVAKVDVYGGRQRQINVRLDPLLMKRHYISIDEVVSTINNKNRNIPGGVLENDITGLNVRFVGEFAGVEDIANLMLTARDGKNFPLKDIATIEDSYKDIDTIARYNGREVVGLSINKASDGNAVAVSRAVGRRIDGIRSTLPDDMHLELATDSTKFIVAEVIDTQWSILIGILLAVVILYLFTGRMSLTFIAAIVIPVSLVSTFFPMSSSGFTINFLTLLAIATALGTLIANAIIIIENVLVHLQHKETAEHAAIDATKEVAGAVIASTGTNLVVFTPIAMMGGIVGQFMRQFGMTVVFATLFSLVASFTLTPMLCALILKKHDPTKQLRKSRYNPLRWLVNITELVMSFCQKEYRYVFDAIFRFPKTTLLLVFLSFWSLRFIMPYIDTDFASSGDEDRFVIKAVLPQGSTIERTSAVVSDIEKHLAKVPEVTSYLSYIGSNGVENASITVDLAPLKERARGDLDIINELVPVMARIPDAEIVLSREGMGSGEGDLSIDLYGIDYDRMIELSAQMKDIMERTGYFRAVTSSYKTPKRELQFIPDERALRSYGLTNAQAGDAIRASVYGDDTNVYKEGGEEYDILVALDERYTRTIEHIEDISVMSSKGLVPVTALGRLENAKSLPLIQHRDKERVIRLEGFLAKSSMGHVAGVLGEEFKKIEFGDGYRYRFVGGSERQEESNREILKAFLLAVILTYMLLAAIMNSAVYPLPIMMTIVTSFIGVFLMLFFTGASMNVISMLGMVMLVGLVVNNAILMLDYTMLKMQEGVPVKEALWLGASEKFRAIIMTSLAIVLGVLPQLWSIMPFKSSMGAVMVGGMLASILYTFIFVPIAFWYLERMRAFFHSLALRLHRR